MSSTRYHGLKLRFKRSDLLAVLDRGSDVLAFWAAGSVLNSEEVPMHVAATILWADKRRATFDCGFDRCASQYLEVRGSNPASLFGIPQLGFSQCLVTGAAPPNVLADSMACLAELGVCTG